MTHATTRSLHPAPAPADPAGQLQWLVDRAAISDLLLTFGRALDERDWDAYGALYVPEGVLAVSDDFRLEGREAIVAGTGRGLGAFRGTWHLTSNYAISVRGDEAETHSYLHAAHLLDDDPARHADGAGWYDCTLRRTAEGWRFVTVRLTEVWTAGAALEIAPH